MRGLYHAIVNLHHYWLYAPCAAIAAWAVRLYFKHGSFVGAWDDFVARWDARIGNVLTANRRPPQHIQVGVAEWANEMSLAEIAKAANVREGRVASAMPRLVKSGIAIPCGVGRWKGRDKIN